MKFSLTDEKVYTFCQRITPTLAASSIVLLMIGWGWGFIFAPSDYLQGESVRIMYLHVPAAIGSMAIYLFMAIAALFVLWLRSSLATQLITAMTPIGMVYTLMALITGSLWGKPMWGAWWVWDGRLTSELVLFFLYISIIALNQAFAERQVIASKGIAILLLVGAINLPIIHYSVEWWQTLHQGSTKGLQSIDSTMRYPLQWAILGYFSCFICLTVMRLQNLLLINVRQFPWLISQLKEGEL